MKKKILIILCLVAAAFALYIFWGEREEKVAEISDEIKAEIQRYNEGANEDGMTIIDMKGNPYFMNKQDGVKYNDVERITYFSKVTGSERYANVLLPVNYDEDKEYPVLYLLHGLGGSHKTWINKKADIIIQNLIYFENVPEMIVVFPNSELNQKGDTDGLSLTQKAKFYDLTEEDLTGSLMPHIEENYSVKSGKENRAIGGNSMGGRNALYTAFKNQDLFDYVGAFSSSYVFGTEGSILKPLLNDFVIDERYGGFEKIMLCVGKQDNVCGIVTYKVDERMRGNGIEHIFYDTQGGHQNIVWQNGLYNYLKLLF